MMSPADTSTQLVDRSHPAAAATAAESGHWPTSAMRFSPNRFASPIPSARTDGTTSLARMKPRPPAFAAARTSSTLPRWTVEPSVTPAAAASASASSEVTTMLEYLSLLPCSAALTSSIGMDVRVDQKLMTGTKGIATLPAGAEGVGEGETPGSSEGVGLGPLVGVLVVAVGVASTPGTGERRLFGSREPVAVGALGRTETPGADVGGVDDPQAATRRATTAKMTSRVLTDRLMTVDLSKEAE